MGACIKDTHEVFGGKTGAGTASNMWRPSMIGSIVTLFLLGEIGLLVTKNSVRSTSASGFITLRTCVGCSDPSGE